MRPGWSLGLWSPKGLTAGGGVCFQDSSFTQRRQEALSSWPHEFSMGQLECPPDMMAGFSQSEQSRRASRKPHYLVRPGLARQALSFLYDPT